MPKITLIIACLALAISISSLILLYNIDKKLTTYGCDMSEAFLAEREYTYPILRTIDDPDNYGKEIKNPIRSKEEYNTPCLKNSFN
jgi:hypothetical protein